MDPFSLTVGCVGLLSSIIDLSKTASKFAIDFRDARKDMESVRHELTSLQLCVETLHDDLSQPEINYPQNIQRSLHDVLHNCDGVTGELKSLLDKFSSNNIGRRIQWTVTGQDGVKKLRDTLEAHKQTIEIALEIVTISIVKAVKDDTADIKDDTAAIREDTMLVPQLLEKILKLEGDIAGLHSDNGNRVFILQRFLDSSTHYAETVREDDGGSVDSTSSLSNPSTADRVNGPENQPEKHRNREAEAASSKTRVGSTQAEPSTLAIVSHVPSSSELAEATASGAMNTAETSVQNGHPGGTQRFATQHGPQTGPQQAALAEQQDHLKPTMIPTWKEPYRYPTSEFSLERKLAANDNFTEFIKKHITCGIRITGPELSIHLKRGVSIDTPFRWRPPVASAQESTSTPLYFACLSRDHLTAKILIEYGADADPASTGNKPFDNVHRPPLFGAILGNELPIVKLLIESGANVNTIALDSPAGPYGAPASPLSYACQNGKSVEIIQCLVDHGADVNAYSPLHKAVVEAKFAAVQLLLDAGADVSALDSKGYSPLQLAAAGGAPLMVEALLIAGAVANPQEEEHRSPLSTAARNVRSEDGLAIKSLIKYGNFSPEQLEAAYQGACGVKTSSYDAFSLYPSRRAARKVNVANMRVLQDAISRFLPANQPP